MKTLIIFLFLTLTTFAQSWHLLWDDTFNPVDANTVAVWSGVNFSDPNWLDQIGGKDLVSTNSPTTGTLNGFKTVIFNGTNEYAENTTLTVARPVTIYLVCRQITFTDLDIISTGTLNQDNPSPNIVLSDGGTFVVSSQLLVNTWNVVTSIIGLQNQPLILRVGLNTAVQDLADDNADLVGFELASLDGISSFGNIEVAYIIIRNTADGTGVQNNFINWLKARFGI